MSLDNKDLQIIWMVYQGAPSIHEMRKAIGARSPGTVHNRLVALEDDDFIKSGGFRKIRSRKITEKGLGVLRDCSMLPDDIYDLEVRKLNAELPIPDGA